MMIAAGGATISSIFLGQKNYNRATDVVNNVLVLCLVHSAIIGGLTLLFLDPILYFFGATDETVVYAREFMEVILLGTPIAFVFIGLNNLMRATGYPKKAMISALISVVVNVILAPLFIFKLKWGIQYPDNLLHSYGCLLTSCQKNPQYISDGKTDGYPAASSKGSMP